MKYTKIPNLNLKIPKSKILDNVDGKQARKTGSSSSLGLLMDHGADSINTGMMVLIVFQIFNAAPYWTYFCFYMVYFVGFFSILEEYYTHELVFPIVNAVNEGVTVLFIFILVGAFTGNEIYTVELYKGVLVYQAFAIFFGGLLGVQSIMIIVSICKHTTAKSVFYHLILYTYISLTFAFVVFFSNSHVVTTQVKVLIYIFIPLFCKTVVATMISHVFEAVIPQFQIFPIFVCTFLNGLVLAEIFLFTGKVYKFGLDILMRL